LPPVLETAVPAANGRIFGCNVIDPLLEVEGGKDYSLAITERSLLFLKGLGHDAIEYSHACHWTVAECEAVRQMTARIGLIPWSLHAWAGGDPTSEAGRARVQSTLATATRNALALGVGIVVHHPSGNDLSAEAELLAGLAVPGVRFALENMQTLASMEYAVSLAEALGPEVAGICVDTGHAALGDLGPARAIRMAGQRLITTHLQDNRGVRDDHMPPGDGAIDWGAVAAALCEVGYAGCVLLELTDQPDTDERRAGIEDELARGARAAEALAAKLPPVAP
jgi:sugar phosphate isomerase/epimerase